MVFSVSFEQLHSHGFELFPVEKELSSQTVERLVLNRPAQRDKITLFHVVARVGQAKNQLPVVGQQKQPLRVAIQPAHRHNARAQPCQQIGHAAAALFVLHGGDVPARLVQHDIGVGRSFFTDKPAVHRNAVALIHLASELRHRAIDAHAARQDHLLSGAPRAQAAIGQIFL